MTVRAGTVAVALTLTVSACSTAPLGSPPAAPMRHAVIVGADRAPTSSAAVVARTAGGYEVFYRAWNGAVYDRTVVAGRWSTPTGLGTTTVGRPAAAAIGSDIVLVTRGPLNGLNVQVRTAGHWSATRSLGLTVTAAPAVTAWQNGRVDVFARGQDRRLYTRTLDRGTPTTPWRRFSTAAVSSAPAVTASGAGRLTVLVTDAAHAVLSRTLDDRVWSGWTSLGARTWDSPAAAAVPGTNRVLALLRGTNDQLYSRELPGGRWQARGGSLVDAPAVAARSGETLIVLRDRSAGFTTRTVRGGTWSAARTAWRLAAMPAPRAGLLGVDWTAFPTTRKVVALTFDAGANADGYAPIRAALEHANVPATFFLTGEWVRTFPALANDVAEDGFLIGNHTDTHPHLTTRTNAQVDGQLRRARTAILFGTGVDARPLFRFPYGDVNARVLGEVNRLGYVAVRWTIDTLGWKGTSGGMTVQKVVDRVLGAVRAGAIVVMHTGSNPKDHTTLDAAALPRVIAGLRARGYGFVTLRALTG